MWTGDCDCFMGSVGGKEGTISSKVVSDWGFIILGYETRLFEILASVEFSVTSFL